MGQDSMNLVTDSGVRTLVHSLAKMESPSFGISDLSTLPPPYKRSGKMAMN